MHWVNGYVNQLRHKLHLEELARANKKREPMPIKNGTLFSDKLDIQFQNLTVTLDNGTVVLDNISGSFKSGHMCAIMGPSGSGKTTLLSAIIGDAERSDGTLYINHTPNELANFKNQVGYVPQEDVMIRQLTVREILMHSAQMRLPKRLTKKEIKKKVLDTLNALGLAHVADSIIGDEDTRGISGGQRKRVNIGMELVAEPSVLFLDEPTSGELSYTD